MPPNSGTSPKAEEPLNEEMVEDVTGADGFQEKPTTLVEVINHLPKDVFEKRPFRAYMAALQVRNNSISSTKKIQCIKCSYGPPWIIDN